MVGYLLPLLLKQGKKLIQNLQIQAKHPLLFQSVFFNRVRGTVCTINGKVKYHTGYSHNYGPINTIPVQGRLGSVS